MLGLQPSECLVVDDAHSGIEAALAGGFDCAAIGDAKEKYGLPEREAHAWTHFIR